MDCVGVTAAQESMWLAQELVPGVPNNVAILWDISGDLDTAVLASATRAAVAEASALRLRFRYDGDGLRASTQDLGKWEPFQLNVSDAADPVHDARAVIADLVRRPFDLGEELLIRFGSIQLGSDRHLLVLVFHHILTDAFGAFTLLSGRIAEIYRALIEDSAVREGAPDSPSAAVARDAAYRASKQSTDAGRFWNEYLAGDLSSAVLPAGIRPPAGTHTAKLGDWDSLAVSQRMVTRTTMISAAERKAWERAGAASETKLSDLITAAAAAFLRHMCSLPEPLFTFTVNHRGGALRRSLGLLSNMVPMRARVETEASFVELARTLRQARLGVLRHARHDISMIKRVTDRTNGTRSPFGAVINVLPVVEALDLAGATGRFVGGNFGAVDEVMLSTYTDGTAESELYVRFDAPSAEYDEQDIAGITERFVIFLRAALTDPHVLVGNVSASHDAERRILLTEYAGSSVPPSSATLTELLDRQARCTPDRVAVIFGDTRLTYRELAERSGRLARLLAERGAGPERFVAVAMQRSLELVVALVAVVRAGAAYIPVDPDYPAARIDFMLSDASPVLILTSEDAAETIPRTEIPTLLINEAQPTEGPVPFTAHQADHPAYLIYTSGSTGRPKGAVVTHAAIVNRLLWMQDRFRLDDSDRVLQKTSASFDVSVWEFFWPLITGATLVVARPDGHRDPSYLAELIRSADVTTVHFVPSMLAEFATIEAAAECSSLRRVICSGEALPPALAARFHRIFDVPLYNLYGPTEAAVDVTAWQYQPNATTIAIGTPVWNTQLYVLDSGLRPLPPGVFGDLYIAGAQLARGYHARRALSAERFVACPFGEPGQRMYRTGDLARWNAAGELEFAGRADAQVKIRGFRIEPQEIEDTLTDHPGVLRAAISARTGRDDEGLPQLVAYVVPLDSSRTENWDLHTGFDNADLRGFVAERLPPHMVPSVFVVLDRLPLSANGKLDRASLPVPEFTPREHRAPHTPEERLLAAAYAEVLGIDQIGVDDDFFTLGGDSIRAIQVVARARTGGLEFSPRAVFECRTVASLARAAGRNSAPAKLDEMEGGGVGKLPLPPMARLYEERGPGLDRLAQWLVVEMPGDVEVRHLTATLGAVLDRHDALRSRLTDAGLLVQPPGTLNPGELIDPVIECTGNWDDKEWQTLLRSKAVEAVQRIDAGNGRMLRLVPFQAESGGVGRLLIAAHHLVVDGLSWRVLLPDFAEAWLQVRKGVEPTVPPVGTSMRRWFHALADEAARPERVEEVQLWRELLADTVAPVGSRPIDPRRDFVGTMDTVRVELSNNLTDAVLTDIPAFVRCGADDVLLTALLLALAHEQRGMTDGKTIVRLEGHGRHDELIPGVDLSRTVGWFTTVTPVRFDISGIDIEDAINGGASAGDALQRVKDQRRGLPDQGIGYTLLRYINDDTASQLKSTSVDEIGFNFLGRFSFESSKSSAGARAESDAGWTPAPECAELVAAPATDMPITSALELNALVTGVGDGAQLSALFDFATGVLAADEVRALAERWCAALRGLSKWAAKGVRRLTPADAALVTVQQEELDSWQRRYGHISDVWPLTPLQEGLLFHTVLARTASEEYQTQFVYRLEGEIEPSRLRAAGQALIDRNPSLRVAFQPSTVGGHVQVVVEDIALPWRHVDLTGRTDAELQFEGILNRECEIRFQLDNPPSLRLTLVTLSPSHAELVLTAHHVIIDGWSVPLIARELLELYADHDLELTQEHQHGFRNYLSWLSQQSTGRSIHAWAKELEGVTEPTLLAPRASGSRITVGGSGQVNVALNREDTIQLARRAAEWGITPNTMVQGAWAMMLAQLTGQQDVLFGTSVACRPAAVEGAETAIGLLINTVPVRVRCPVTDTVRDVLGRLQGTQAKLLEHQYLGLADIQRATGLGTLFDTLVVFESFPVDRTGRPAAGEPSQPIVTGVRPYAPPHYPLTLIAAADPLLRLSLQYRCDTFERIAVETLADRLVRVLRQFTDDLEPSVSALDVLTDTERDHVLHLWNDTEVSSSSRTVPELIADQFSVTPNANGVTFGGNVLTYQELDERSSRLAHWLTDQGVGPESRVVVLLPRSADLVVALLAVWKAGGAYVPVDPEYPAARIQSVIEDSAAVMVLDKDRLGEVDLSNKSPLASKFPQVLVGRDHAAYIIYTSGSTGTPKGVVVQHGALATMLLGMQDRFDLTADDRMVACATVAFDIAALEIFLPLITGGLVVLAGKEDLNDPTALRDLVVGCGATIMQATPGLWQNLVSQESTCLTGLRAISTGEALPLSLAEGLARHAREITNLYGPTETTIYATAANISLNGRGMPPSVGHPVPGTRVLILGPSLRPVAPGVTGDLWITGEHLARGYHGLPGMTAERFVACPYGPPASRMYRSGDLARWTADGEVEYLGRSDHQVKLRGFRIELSEIEHVLIRFTGARRAVVIVREDVPGNRQLVAYLVPQIGAEPPSDEFLRKAVMERLPGYMTPTAFVILPELPLTPNGKLDRSALPRPEFGGGDDYRAPRSPREKALCALFAEVLGHERIGVDDDFFGMGGHSLLATRLVARVRAEMGVNIPMQVLFTASSVAELTARWNEMSASTRIPLRKMTGK